MNENKNTVIYVRVSTKEQVDEGNSLVTQERACTEYAKKQGLKVLQVFTERGESAKTANRTELKNLLAFCSNKKNKVACIIIYKIDRLARNTHDYSYLKALLNKYGVEIKSVSENIENSPVGHLVETMLSSIAQFDNDVRAERCSNGMREAVREGRYVWRAPIGYKNTVDILGKATITKSDMNPLILECFELLATGLYTVDDVRKRMIEKGLRLSNGKHPSRAYFYEILRNELYAGLINKFGEIHKGNFDPIVDVNLFNKVQILLKEKRKNISPYKINNPIFPLRRFVVDLGNHKITGSYSTGRNGKRYPYYRFSSKGTNYNQDVFEEKFCEFMDSFRLNSKDYRALLLVIRNKFHQKIKKEKEFSTKLIKFLDEVPAREEQLIQKNLDGIISDDVLKRQLDKLQNEASDTRRQLDELTEQLPNLEGLLRFSRDYLNKPSIVWKKIDIENKLRLQSFQFPRGVQFDGLKFGTTEVASVFNVRSVFSESDSSLVDPTGFEPVTSSLQMRRSTN